MPTDMIDISTPATDAKNETVAMASDRPRCLIVDDHDHARAYLSEALDERGFACTTSDDPGHAWELVERDPSAFQLMVIDVHFPTLPNGLVVARKIRDLVERVGAKLKIVVVTGDSRFFDPTSVEIYGCDDVLPKPFNLNLLRQII